MRNRQPGHNLQDTQLIHRRVQILEKYGTSNWIVVASVTGHRTPQQCMHRWRKLMDHKKGHWTYEEDRTLYLASKAFPPDDNRVTTYGYVRKRPKYFWADISKFVPMVRTRCNRGCARNPDF